MSWGERPTWRMTLIDPESRRDIYVRCWGTSYVIAAPVGTANVHGAGGVVETSDLVKRVARELCQMSGLADRFTGDAPWVAQGFGPVEVACRVLCPTERYDGDACRAFEQACKRLRKPRSHKPSKEQTT